MPLPEAHYSEEAGVAQTLQQLTGLFFAAEEEVAFLKLKGAQSEGVACWGGLGFYNGVDE